MTFIAILISFSRAHSDLLKHNWNILPSGPSIASANKKLNLQILILEQVSLMYLFQVIPAHNVQALDKSLVC